MNDIERNTLGSIARLAEQMSYSAMNAHTEMLKAQFLTLKKQMAKLDTIKELLMKEA